MFNIRYRFVLVLLLAIYSYLNILFTVGETLFDFEVSHLTLFMVLLAVVLMVWELNRLVEINLNRATQFFRNKIHPLILLFLTSILNVAIACSVVLPVLYVAEGIPFPIHMAHITLLLAFGFRVNLFLNCINAIVFYMNRSKKAQLEAEQFKKISMEAQFEALRNQINPHFLFNSFNVLSTLVYKDADTEAKFIGQLSHVYRYLLYNQEKKVVALQDEVEFIRAYLFLLEIRFGNNLIVKIENLSNTTDHYIPPATLQMLIENAIKHNVVSQKKPLTIKITKTGDTLIIANNLQRKAVQEPSTQVGLKNIISRYVFLSDRKVIIHQNEEHFTVSLPLLAFSEK